MIPTTSLVLLLSAILTALGDVQRPTQGHQIGFGPGSSYDVIFPLTITQCEPVIIYYNLTDRDYAFLMTLDIHIILYLWFPAGVGYLDWICDIPTGHGFFVGFFRHFQYYTVQPGSSSACLGDITTTYSYASYNTTDFQSYTQHSPSGNPTNSAFYQLPTIDFPTSSFSTITVNPNLAVTPTTARSTSSPLSSPVTPTTTGSAASSPLSPPSTASSVSSHKSNTPVIAGGVKLVL